MADEKKVDGGSPKKVEESNEAVQKAVDVETEQGFRGVEVDQTPNENYTVAGVTSGAPTPETDPKQAEAVGSRKFAGGVAKSE